MSDFMYAFSQFCTKLVVGLCLSALAVLCVATLWVVLGILCGTSP